jgi:uncharacterized protein YcbK (DUF882 family)
MAALLLVVGSRGLHDAVANGDTRTLSFSHTHRDDQITVTFKRNGRYDEDGLKKLNHFLRDWRNDDQTQMAAQLFDILWEVYREVGGKQPIHIVSSYRSPNTNAMLHRRSSGVARNSLHMQGKAIDFFIPGVSLEELRIAGLRLQRGGVGYYPTSGSPFVHMDVGNVRHWPRMTRDQLARVFPNGRTIHVPTDGRPLSGYELAMADQQRRGGVMTADASGSGNLLSKLFGGSKDSKDDEEEAAPAPSRGKPTTVAAPDKPAKAAEPSPAATPVLAKVPLPPAKPTFQLASAPLPPPRPARPAPDKAPSAAEMASLTANQIINLRGYWHGLPPVEAEARQLRVAAAAPRPTRTTTRPAADVETTASLTPWPREDRVPPDVALAYAAQPAAGSDAVSRAEPMGASLPRLPKAADTTVAVKKVVVAPTTIAGTMPKPAGAAKVGDRLNLPWLRALIVTPSVQTYLTTTMFGAPDFQYLTALMQKPASTVLMTFAAEPNQGLQTQQFSGSAVVFQATMTFSARTAALR